MYVSANFMRFKNKSGWEKINHVQNYKNALNKYGFEGIKIYEDFFYKGIPLPENRSFAVKIGLFFAPLFAKYIEFKNKITKKLHDEKRN